MQCKCKQGYYSLWDNKCANCRTKKEAEEHNRKMKVLDQTPTCADWYALYREA